MLAYFFSFCIEFKKQNFFFRELYFAGSIVTQMHSSSLALGSVYTYHTSLVIQCTKKNSFSKFNIVCTHTTRAVIQCTKKNSFAKFNIVCTHTTRFESFSVQGKTRLLSSIYLFHKELGGQQAKTHPVRPKRNLVMCMHIYPTFSTKYLMIFTLEHSFPSKSMVTTRALERLSYLSNNEEGAW